MNDVRVPRSGYGIGLSDVPRIVRAAATNLLAFATPRMYLRLVGETGRGAREESAQEIADYLAECFADYQRVLAGLAGDVRAYLEGKRILEYGPGDVLGVAMLLVAHGAARVVCVDRFPIVALSAKNVAVLRCLLDGLQGETRERAAACFRTPGDPASGFVEDRVRYHVGADGLSGLRDEADIALSRAVLEHVNNLPATFVDMRRALVPGGICVHQVDLKSHGLHRRQRLDFLTWSPFLWRCMYSQKGVPNRWRVDRYRDAIAQAGLVARRLEPTERAQPDEIAAIRPYLAPPFRDVSDRDLAWLGFWLIAEKPRAAAET